MKRMILEVGGRELPCRLTMGAMLRYKQQTGEEVSQLTDGDLEKMLWLMWCCIESACHADGVDLDMGFDLFCDSLTPADMQRWNELMGQGGDEEEKKSEG